MLDLCCGTGLLAGELIARGYRVDGVDAADAMLALLARERLGPGGGVAPDDASTSRSKVSSTRRSARSTASTISLRRSCG